MMRGGLIPSWYPWWRRLWLRIFYGARNPVPTWFDDLIARFRGDVLLSSRRAGPAVLARWDRQEGERRAREACTCGPPPSREDWYTGHKNGCPAMPI